jgi:hypothetical protein
MQYLTYKNPSVILAPLQSTPQTVLLAATNTILRHTIVAPNDLSYFLNFAQTVLSARYSNVHHHSQLFQNVL